MIATVLRSLSLLSYFGRGYFDRRSGYDQEDWKYELKHVSCINADLSEISSGPRRNMCGTDLDLIVGM